MSSNITLNIPLPDTCNNSTYVITITGKRNIDDNETSLNITNEVSKKPKLDNPDCGKYNGEMKDGKRHGKGEMKFANGGIYNGDWKDGKIDGKGEMKFHSGAIYNGDWKDNEKDGKGEMKYANGDIYNGDLKNNKRHGKGEMKYANGDIYNGDWKFGKKDDNGNGELISRKSTTLLSTKRCWS